MFSEVCIVLIFVLLLLIFAVVTILLINMNVFLSACNELLDTKDVDKRFML